MISNETIECLNQLIQQGFILNRLWDRGMSVLGVDFAMNKFVKIFHEGLAHRFPVDWSDYFAHILEQYNIKAAYYVTPEDVSEYATPIDFFDKNLEYHRRMYDLLKKAMNVAVLNGDVNVEKALNHFILTFNRYMEQALLLKDKAVAVNGNWFLFDSMCDDFYLF